MPAPTLAAQGNIAAVTTGDLAITLPAYAANDIVVITTVGWIPNTTTGTNTQSLASPWTKYTPAITSGNPIDTEHAFWWARATSASSLGTTVTITRPASWDTGTDTCWAGRAYTVSGCVTTGNPYDELAATALSTLANPQIPAVTVSGGNRLAIIFMTKADNSATPTAATGYTVGTEVTTNTGTDAAFQSYRQTASANISAVTPTGGVAPAQGDSVYFEVAFVPVRITATASAPLGTISGSGTATVTRSATAAASLGTVAGSATATVRRFATAAAPLGAITATATATVTKPTVTAIGSAPLGTMSATASATIRHDAAGSAPLGTVTATTSATIQHDATATAPLNGLTANATATTVRYAAASTNLGTITAAATAATVVAATAIADIGNLNAAATAATIVIADAEAGLNGLTGSATANITIGATAEANLGHLIAAANSQVVDNATATAQLGVLNATAIATITPPPPPPTQAPTTFGKPHFDIRPVTIPTVEQPARERATIQAAAHTEIESIFAFAMAEIKWSTLADEEELLLLL